MSTEKLAENKMKELHEQRISSPLPVALQEALEGLGALSPSEMGYTLMKIGKFFTELMKDSEDEKQGNSIIVMVTMRLDSDDEAFASTSGITASGDQNMMAHSIEQLFESQPAIKLHMTLNQMKETKKIEISGHNKDNLMTALDALAHLAKLKSKLESEQKKQSEPDFSDS